MRATLTTLCLIFFLVFCWVLANYLQSPPGSISAQAEATVFSAERAFTHLLQISQKPHSTGTPEHEKVKDYIADYCRSMGLKVQIQDTIAWRSSGTTTTASNVKNIVAKLAGSMPGRDILVVSHYDSQPNTLGASDDGAGVSAMLESIRALKKGPPLQNDVIFLFTDQEERGLLGAEAFASLHPSMPEVEIVLNYDSRGNRGTALCFEVSHQNGWIIRQFAKAASRPIANSLAYEIYKLMPNDTDFTIFRQQGVTGLNQANVDGFVNYHSMTDTPDNIDLRVIQHHGDNMLTMVRHLGMLDLTNTKSRDINFFNPLGSWLLVYPASWNLPLIILCLILFIWNVTTGINRGVIRARNLLIGSAVYLVSLIFNFGAAVLLVKLVLWYNPHFSNFNANNFYNIHWYWWSFVGLWLVINSLLYRKLWKSIGHHSLTMGAALILISVMIVLQLKLPTAAFFIYYPLTWLLVFHGIMIMMSEKGKLLLAGTVPLAAMGLWVPLGTTLFVVFSFQIPLAAMVVLGFLWVPLLPAVHIIEQFKYSPVLVLGILLLSTGLGVGQLKASFDANHPLQTGVTYVANRDTQQAVWVSVNNYRDPWSAQLLNHPQKEPFQELYPRWQVWKGEAQYIELPASELIIEDDSRRVGVRNLSLKLIPGKEVIGVELWFDGQQTFNSLTVDGRAIPAHTQRLIIAAIDQQVQILISGKLQDVKFRLIERSLGIPEDLLQYPMTREYIFGPGIFNNAILISRQVVLQI